MATRTISNAGGNWTDVGTWVEGAVPTNADAVVATATSGNVTISAASVCLSADFTNYVGTLTHNAFNWTIGNSGTTDISFLKFVPGMTYTTTNNANCKVIMNSRYNSVTITSAGKSIRHLTISNNVGSFGLTDTLTVIGSFVVSNSTFSFGSQNANCGIYNFAAGTVDLGTGTLTGTSFSNSAGCVLTENTSTVLLTGGGFISLGGFQFHNLTINGALTILDDLFATNIITINGGSVLTFSSGIIFYLNGPSELIINSTSGNIVEFKSNSLGSEFFIAGDGVSTYSYSYLKLTDSNASGGTFNANYSIDVSGNTGWNFIPPPSTGNNSFKQLLPRHSKSILNIMLNTFKPNFVQNKRL